MARTRICGTRVTIIPTESPLVWPYYWESASPPLLGGLRGQLTQEVRENMSSMLSDILVFSDRCLISVVVNVMI